MATTGSPHQRQKARRYAEELERDADAYPDERTEILLEAASKWAAAGEPERALKIQADLMDARRGEDAEFAASERISLLFELGRDEEAEAELARLDRARVSPGPAELIGELLESRGHLEEALTWFNVACRDLLADETQASDEISLFTLSRLRGRQRVRRALGLPPDSLDSSVEEGVADLLGPQGGATEPEPAPTGSFFVRSDIERAFAEGLVHTGSEALDASSYYPRVESGWRASMDESGAAQFRILPVKVDDLLRYAKEQGRDPEDEQTRADHLRARIAEGVPTLAWPLERNAPCWCASGRKYKKCCGSPTNR
ncbi:SEC-C domain-containing protein [Actinomadura mexicana]|uniref:SEC-C motif-containing protein n=1 Tax=Actinomadura mexicana TaxID=134959 RepID=A0A238UXE7_9ACTN|nr:SEC-C domain-containing protein [Actinomadura mexicana]SNR25919.1 SEC-C motif-containing protein [Actinomadura mexicana]